MSRWVAITALIACAAAAVLFADFLTAQRELVAGIPTPRPFLQVDLVEVPAGEQLCASDVTIPPRAELVRFAVGTFGRPGPRLEVTLRAGGYQHRSTVAAGYPDNTLIQADVNPPAAARLGVVCIVNRGTTRIALTATTEERTESRPAARVGPVGRAGRPVEADVYLAFYESATQSVLQRTDEIVEHMSVFRPGVVGPWLLWPLIALVLLGIPAGVLAAALSAVRGDREP